MIRALALVAAIGGCSHRNAARVSAAVAVASLACDGGTTEQFLAHGYREQNLVLGGHPSSLALWSYLGAWAVGAVLSAELLPPWAGITVGAGITIFEVDAVAHNHVVGSRLCGLGRWRGR